MNLVIEFLAQKYFLKNLAPKRFFFLQFSCFELFGAKSEKSEDQVSDADDGHDDDVDKESDAIDERGHLVPVGARRT